MTQDRPLVREADLLARTKSLISLVIGCAPLLCLTALWFWALPAESTALTTGQEALFERAWGRGAITPILSTSGEWWRLWSAPLAHASPAHLSANLLALSLTLAFGWRCQRWGGVQVGLRCSLWLYQSAVLCFAIRALSVGGWSSGLSGGVMSLMGLLAAQLAQARSRWLSLWGPLCVLYLLRPEVDADQLVHLLGFTLGLGGGLLQSRLRSSWILKRSATSWLLTALHCGVLCFTWWTLSKPAALWSSWRALPHVEELGGPALGNGLCYLGPLTQARAQFAPWVGGAHQAQERALEPLGALLIRPVNEQMAVATLTLKAHAPLASSAELTGLVCLSPLHLWPMSERRQRWLKGALLQLESARAHMSP